MSDSVVPRPLTRSASKQNYSAQPVTAIAAVRDKFEKHRGHIKSKSDVPHASGMEAETHELSDDAFADSPTHFLSTFSGFDINSADHDIYKFICERINDYLPGFPVEVIGTSMNHVGFVVPLEHRDAVFTALKAHEDKFTFEGTSLSIISIDIAHVARFSVPKSSAVDPFVADDPWRGQAAKLERLTALRVRIGKPIVDTRRASSAHSGLSPELIRKQQTLTAILSREGPMLKPLDRVPEFPTFNKEGSPDPLHTMLSSLVSGMNEVRATLSHVVTRDDLRALHEAQSAEMKTYVQAETAPLHAGFSQLATDFQMVAMDAVDHDERIGKLEINVTELQKRVDSQTSIDKQTRNSPDVSFTKLAVKKFPENASLEERLGSMREFMNQHFPKITATFSVRHRGNWKERGKNRAMTAVGFIDVGDADTREFVISQITARKLTLKCNTVDLKIARALTESAKDRNTALVSASDLLKKQVGVTSSEVVIVWETRSIEVRKQVAFKQPSGQGFGAFMNSFSHLELP